ncbi:MAG: hypothetical protein M1496_05020 [Candidatus Thermoplasmatota archaeon]|jgi:hypothetical protein|nr:hypothetical protein [Candidatus Thermoplasmatota archaeon]
MIREIPAEEINKYELPFVPYLFPENNGRVKLRIDDVRHITLVQDLELGGMKISVKEFFLDWFYSGFPKNLMKTSSEPYSNLWRTMVMINGRNIPAFFGKDYKGRFAASFNKGGLNIEIRSDSDFSEIARDLIERINPRPVNKKFLELSYYINNQGWRWFEEERIGRMKWNPLLNERLGDYYGDSHGNFQDMHAIRIYRNTDGDYLWVDQAMKGTGIKNLYYRFDVNGTLFSDVSEMNNWKVFLLSEYGPAILRSETGKLVNTVTLPYIEMGDVWKYIDLIEKLNLIDGFP